jgi:hypothetical protein
MAAPALPNFFLVGTGKAGTTSLHRYLQQHPQIYMSPVKEPSYFASEIRPENLTQPLQRHLRLQSLKLAECLKDGKPVSAFGWLPSEWDEYLRLFANVKDEQAVGEASAIYLWSETAARNIHARVPDAKVIMILRDPAERAFSQYLHQVSVGFTRSSFREHIEKCERLADRRISILYPFLEIGLYYQQVKRFLDVFPQKQIRIYWYEQDWHEPRRLLSDIFKFLEVDASFQPDLSRKALERRAPRLTNLHYCLKQLRLWYPLRSLVPASLIPTLRRLAFRRGADLSMRPEDRSYLINYYREDIRQLGALLGHDLSAWLSVSRPAMAASRETESIRSASRSG